ncbi:MAG: tetratricopeptide repeat protein [Tannerella sp.]|nr:tetratricopeptide repeat protein [Tannerella sp.]
MARKIQKQAFLLILCSLFSGQMAAQQSDWQLLIDQKQYSAVITRAANLQTADSADFNIMYAVAQAYEGLLKYRDAYRCYQYCLAIDPTQTSLMNTIARMAANIGKTKEAEYFFQQVLSRDSTDFYANYQLARLYSQLGEDDKAISYYERLLEQDPDNPVLLRALGECFSRFKELGIAAMYYRQAFQNNKENVSLASTLVNTLLQTNRMDEALAACDTALIYNPGNQLLLRNKGAALFGSKRYEQADSLYSILLAQNDSSYLTIKYAGCSKYYAQKYMDAIELLELAYIREPAAIDVCLILGASLGLTYDKKRAYKLFDQAEALMQPDTAFVYMLKLGRADTYARDNRSDEASSLYYSLWKENRRMDLLARIWANYGTTGDIRNTEDETVRQRTLFIDVLMAMECLKSGKNEEIAHYTRHRLEVFREDMFFRSLKEYTMLDPDNKKSVISIDKLQDIIDRLPEKN